MDNFERYLREQKEDFQLQEINPAIWEGILREERPAPRQPLRKYYVRWLSAAAIIGMVIGWSLFGTTESSPEISADLLEEFGFQRTGPSLVADAKLAELTAMSIPDGYEEAYTFMLQEIKDLDNRNSAVLEELEHAKLGTYTQRQVLKYYRKKVDLLHQLIEDLQKIQHNEKVYPATTSSL